MITNKTKLSNWINYTIRISPSIFTRDLINTNLNKFWNNIVEKELQDNQHIIFLFRLQWSDNQFATIGNLQRLNIEDKNYVLNKIVDEMVDKGGYYLEHSIISLVFTYAIRNGKAIEKTISSNVQFHNYQHHKLPITMDPLNYGKLIDKFGDTYIIQVNPKNIATITQFEDHNEIKFYRSGELTYHYIDKWIDKDTFSRTLGNKEWIFRNNEQILYQVEKSSKFISPLIKSDILQNKIITIDIETFIKDGIHIPYVISWYDGEKNFSYYLTDFNSSDDMIIKSLKDLMVKSYDNFKVYIHNLSRFDGIFLLKILANLGECQPIIHDDKIISIGFKFKGYDITFRDSKQLLIGSLRSLGKSFNVDIQKGYFPYTFVNKNNLNYIGITPDFILFDNISHDEYDGITSYNWNLREEAIKYCQMDCVSLYQIVIKFNNLIFEQFKINIHKYPTISSLAFAIYRSYFMESNLIPQLSGQIAKDIRQSYTGGAVDMYIPQNPDETNVYVYDVNALYSFTMDQFDMPIGKPILFEGDIRAIEPDAFGFFYCKIIAPDNLIKLRRVTSKNIWNISTFNINNRIFTKTLFENIFSKYWKGIESKFTDHNHMFILFKIKYVNGEFATIGKLQRLSLNDKDWYINWIINNMEFKSEYYNETQIDSFIISYGFKDGKITDKNIIKSNLNHQIYKNNKLVISFNPLDYGKVLSITDLDNDKLYILQNRDNLVIKILSSENKNIIEYFKDGDQIIKFSDIKLKTNSFIRILDTKKYYFENNEQILFTKDIKTKFINKLPKSKNLINNFITLDIETYIKDNILIPYCISMYDGKTIKSFFITDYKDSADMLLSALKSILIRKYNGYNIYIHNIAKFDIIFLFKYLIDLGKVTPIIHNGRIISINLNYGKNLDYRIQFKDSYLILLASLAKLTKGFMVDTLKSIFPYVFVNENNLDYIGPVPDFKYFDNKISLSEYNNYKEQFNNKWDLKLETIKYCQIDCISLYQVINKFSDLIFSLFGKNIHHYPTLPSLAFAIFRSTFLDNDIIPQLSGQVAKDIRQSYTGGAVDMYIPKPPKGTKIWVYDVNSLYPYVMSKFDMPVGKPIYFEGDIRAIEPDAFGFFYCEIIAPDNLMHPILQTHVKINNMTRTIAPTGCWKDMIFSEELNNAVKYGYKFNILWGYKFERKNIFKGYVDNLYNLRLNYPKSDPLNYIAKILLNSLYGRFGMNDSFNSIEIIHKDFLGDFENRFLDLIVTKTVLDDYILIETKPIEQIEDDESTHNISIGIAAAITAYARIHMSQFKNNPNFNLYYSDTDSIYVDKPLPDYLVDNKILGKMKLEYICKNAIFLSPKVYYLETEDGKVIYKVKGLKHEMELTMNDFEQLLYKESLLQKFQTKWTKSLSDGDIKIREVLYTLKVTDNKRKLIYDNNDKLFNTIPYIINENNEIINK